MAASGIGFVQDLALVFSHSSVYGLEHSVTKASIEKSFSILTQLLQQAESVGISILENELLVDRNPVPTRTPAVDAFTKRLSAIEVASFSLERGISKDEFLNVIELLHSKPEEMKAAGGFAAVVQTLGMTCVKAKRVTFRELTEDDLVVSKVALTQQFGADSNDIVAFLKGEASEEVAAEVGASLRGGALNVSNIAKLIAAAVEDPPDASPSQRADKAVDCVRRVYDQLASGPAATTQKGRKQLVKELEDVRSELLTMVAQPDGQPDEKAAAVIEDAVGEMVDELMIDSLAAEYSKKRRAIDASEKRILRYLRTKGEHLTEDPSLLDRLVAGGLSTDEWEDLLVKSGVSLTTSPQGGGTAALDAVGAATTGAARVLGELLHRLESAAGEKVPAGAGISQSDDFRALIARVSAEVNAIAGETETKIGRLAAEASEPSGDAAKPRVSRKRFLAMIAEIVQELRQPMAVINCCASLVMDGRVGAVSERQIEPLSLVIQSVRRLDHIVQRLGELSGLPVQLAPDSAIIKDLYNGENGGAADKATEPHV